jgi:hypothetical protein
MELRGSRTSWLGWTLSAALVLSLLTAIASPAGANQAGDAGRFHTWTGYDVDRRSVGTCGSASAARTRPAPSS